MQNFNVKEEERRIENNLKTIQEKSIHFPPQLQKTRAFCTCIYIMNSQFHFLAHLKRHICAMIDIRTLHT